MEEDEYLKQSKSKNFKSQMKDFIVDDTFSDDENDEDYNELEDSTDKSESNGFKTLLDATNEFVYLKDILHFLNQNNNAYYNHLMSMISDKDKFDLSVCIDKTEKRLIK
jgi:hypothetical protein